MFSGLDARFVGEFAAPARSESYAFRVGIATAVVVTAVFTYFAIIAGILFGVYWHATSGLRLFSDKETANVVSLVLYVAPVVIGVVLAVFLVKPLFAPVRREQESIELKPDAEPVLFKYVETICREVGAPMPSAIRVDCNVNASASFRRGFASFRGNDVVLTLGLPLAASMTLPEFTGVVAHELGHFTQRAGMRTGYVLRYASGWLWSAAFKRDQWDWRLDRAVAGGGFGGIAAGLCRVPIWLTRLLLQGLMLLVAMALAQLAQEDERDADQYEMRLCGSRAFVSTHSRLVELSEAMMLCREDIVEWFREGRLPDNLPRLFHSRIATITPEVREKMKEELAKEKTSPFASHPASIERVKIAEAEKHQGIFRSALPATALFAAFDFLARQVSTEQLKLVFGDDYFRVTIHRWEQCEAATKAEIKRGELSLGYYGGHLHLYRPILSPAPVLQATRDPQGTLETLRDSRQLLAQYAPGIETSIDAFYEATRETWKCRSAALLVNQGLKFSPRDFDLKDASIPAIDAREAAWRAKAQRAETGVVLIADSASERLHAALSMLLVKGMETRVADAERKRARAKQLVAALYTVGEMLKLMPQIHLEEYRLGCVLDLLGSHDTPKLRSVWQRAAYAQANSLHAVLASAQSGLRDVPYPFEHDRAGLTIAGYVLPEIGPPHEVDFLYACAGRLHTEGVAIYGRILRELAEIAEEVETTLGFKKLVLPDLKTREIRFARS